MTAFATWLTTKIEKINLGEFEAPKTIEASEISLIVPVKDNQTGIERLLKSLNEKLPGGSCPLEVIIVDNQSSPPLALEKDSYSFPIITLLCQKTGPASARNAGASKAKGKWLLFLDSDCIPTSSLIDGYKEALNESIAYSGSIKAYNDNYLARFYESQKILKPPKLDDGSPHYLVTANALIYKPAFDAIGGFDESFPIAAGEDIDIGLRLNSIGSLSYADNSLVYHEFEVTLHSLIQRFARYGRGNRLLAKKHDGKFAPRSFLPYKFTVRNFLYTILAYVSLLYGFYLKKPDVS